MAAWPSGKARDCKSLIPRFESGCRLHPHECTNARVARSRAGVRVFRGGAAWIGEEKPTPDTTPAHPLGKRRAVQPPGVGTFGSSFGERPVRASRSLSGDERVVSRAPDEAVEGIPICMPCATPYMTRHNELAGLGSRIPEPKHKHAYAKQECLLRCAVRRLRRGTLRAVFE